MKVKTMIFVLLLSVCLTGCHKQNTEIPVEVTDSTSQQTCEPTAVPTQLETLPVETVPEETTPDTAPVERTLGIAAGAYQLRFEDLENNTFMDYYVFIPENATENMPLLIFLHGDGEVAQIGTLENNAVITPLREIYGDNFPFIVIAPCTQVKSWIDWSIPDTLKKLLDDTVSAYCIDPEQIFITGHSRGATGVWNMINTHGDFFAAAAPLSCYSWTSINEDIIVQVPIRAFCGNYEYYERDYSVAMQAQVEQIVRAGGDAEFTLFAGASHMQIPGLSYTEDLFQWMLSQGCEDEEIQ